MGVINKIPKTACVPPSIYRFSSEESINSLATLNSEPPTPPETITGTINESSQNIPTESLIEKLKTRPQSRKRIGARKARRLENERMMQTLLEDEAEYDVENCSPDINDLRPNFNTPLTQLMTDVNNLRVWNYFLSHSEEEQKQFLEENTVKRTKSTNKGPICSDEVKEKPMKVLSPEERFVELNSTLRKALSHRVPLGILSRLEDDVVDTFVKNSSAVYLSNEIASFERLLLHAICQYHLLKSWSINIDGSRRTKVVNRNAWFLPPKKSLAEYVEVFQN